MNNSSQRIHPAQDTREMFPDRLPVELRWQTRHRRSFGYTVEECRRRRPDALLRLKAGDPR
jgi:hypothetical protein